MKAEITYNNKYYNIDLSKPLDISLSLRGDDKNPVAWYLQNPKIFPLRDGEFVGKVAEGGSVNFNNVQFNPHAHGTHTECVGHITREFHSINDSLKTFFFPAKLISIEPEKRGEDMVKSLWYNQDVEQGSILQNFLLGHVYLRLWMMVKLIK